MFPALTKWRNAPWLVFALVCAWKIALFLVSAQPVPANDSFFYDGAVVNELMGGGYFNPTIAQALPISGTKVFSAYPPLHEAVIWCWMRIFGTSALAQLAFHLVVFCAYAFVVYRILTRLRTPVWCFHFAGIYLLILTWHDRPDSLAHLLGMLAVLSFLCSRKVFSDADSQPASPGCVWSMVLLLVLTLATSLQIGSVYLMWVWFGMLATTLAGREKFPFAAMAATVLVPVGLVLMVKFFLPQCWAGFLEHARQTPSLTGWRWPHPYDVLKVARTVPGIVLVAILLPWSWFKQHNDVAPGDYVRTEFVLVPGLLAALGPVAACLFIWTPYIVSIASFMQPVIVGSYLSLYGTIFADKKWLRTQVICLSLAAALGSIRAIGMSTWGLACAMDVGYPTAIRRIESELNRLPPQSTVVVSPVFLYDAAQHRDLILVHCDWMGPAKTGLQDEDIVAFKKLKPTKLILTQFDFYRRYQRDLNIARNLREVKQIEIVDCARIRPPDAYPSLQRVLQHISWAPVIVTVTWSEP